MDEGAVSEQRRETLLEGQVGVRSSFRATAHRQTLKGVKRETEPEMRIWGTWRVEAMVVAKTVQRTCSAFQGGPSGTPGAQREETCSTQTRKELPASRQGNQDKEVAETPSKRVSRRE